MLIAVQRVLWRGHCCISYYIQSFPSEQNMFKPTCFATKKPPTPLPKKLKNKLDSYSDCKE